MLLNNKWVNNEIKEAIKRYPETKENEHTKNQHLWDSKISPKREILSIIGLPQETGKIPNKQFNFTLKETRKRATYNAQSDQKKANNKDQSRDK